MSFRTKFKDKFGISKEDERLVSILTSLGIDINRFPRNRFGEKFFDNIEIKVVPGNKKRNSHLVDSFNLKVTGDYYMVPSARVTNHEGEYVDEQIFKFTFTAIDGRLQITADDPSYQHFVLG